MSMNPKYSSPAPAGMSEGYVSVVVEGFSWWPVVSSVQTELDPRPAVNSWASYSALCPVIDPDSVKVMVDDPVEVTWPYQSSYSRGSPVPTYWIALLQVVTPPPETEVVVTALSSCSSMTTSTSPTVCGSTDSVVMAAPKL